MLISTLRQSMTAPLFLPSNHKRKSRRDSARWYNRKNRRGKTVVQDCAYFLSKEPNLKFVTITTVQHKNKMTDKQCWGVISNWLRLRNIHMYISTVERQRNGDLHFHLILSYEKNFDFKTEVNYFAQRFKTIFHPALFDVEHILCDSNRSMVRVVNYVANYTTKSNEYSSLFFCRTFSISKKLREVYKKNAYEINVRVKNPIDYADLLKVHSIHKYAVSFTFSEFIFETERQKIILDLERENAKLETVSQ